MMMNMTEKPKTLFDVEELVHNGDISVMHQDFINNEYHFLICDHRRTYEEGEVYEVVVA
jgi:hypothetical protein